MRIATRAHSRARMSTSQQLWLTLALTLVCFSAFSMPVRYTYTGNAYTFFDEGGPSGLTRTSGYFELPEAFGPDFSGPFEPTHFEFTNGVDTLSDASNANAFFNMVTDETGSPIAWLIGFDIEAFNEGDLGALRTFNNLAVIPSVNDSTAYCEVDNSIGVCTGAPGAEVPVVGAANLDSPGTWTIQVVPIPAAVWLFGSALGLLGWLRRRAA